MKIKKILPQVFFSLSTHYMSRHDPDVLSWSGMVDAVGADEYDIGFTGFSQVEERFAKV